MKWMTGLVAGATATLLMVGPGLTVGPGLAADSPREATPAEKPGKLAIPHSVKGNVVSVDESANTFTVQDSNGKEFVLTANPSTGRPALGDVKAGDSVKVSYKKSRSGQMIVTKIAPADSMRTRTR